MPELFQLHSGMMDAGRDMVTNSTDRLTLGEDEVRNVQLVTDVDWTDGAGADLLAVTNHEFGQTSSAAEHQAAQGRGYDQCAADGASTLSTCRGIAASL